MSDLVAEARSLMSNPAFVDILERARKQIIEAAMACDVKDDEGRRRYLDAARIVEMVPAHLNALIVASKTGEEVDPSDFYKERARTWLRAFSK